MKSIEELTISDYFKIFRRRIWYVLITAVVVGAVAVAYVWHLPSTYKSETTILVGGRLLPNDFIQSLDRQTTNDRIDFVRRQLESRTFLERIVQEFQFQSSGASMQSAVAFVQGHMDFQVVSSSAFKLAYTSTDPAMAQAVTRRLGEMVIQLNDSTARERVQDADQFLEEQLRQAANDMHAKEEALLQFRKLHFPGVSGGSVTPDGLGKLQGELSGVETRLADAIDSQQGLELRLREQDQLKNIMTAPRQPVQQPISAPAAAASPLQTELARKQSELIGLSSRYTREHPEVVRLTREIAELNTLIAKAAPVEPRPSAPAEAPSVDLPQVDLSIFTQAEIESELHKLKRDIAALEQSKREVNAKISQYLAQLSPQPSIAQELGGLERDKDAAERAYKLLADRKLSSAMAARVDASQDNEVFKVLDPAFLPQMAVGPNRRLFAAVGGLGGLLLGLALAFARDMVDPTLQDEAAAAAELRLPIMAGVPELQEKFENKKVKRLSLPVFGATEGLLEAGTFHLRAADPKVRDVIMDPISLAGEPYRLMQAKLSLMQKERGIKTILITSAVPNEGKTFSACCLAGMLARQRDKKVLLIDADLRTGSAGRTLGLNGKLSGLQELLDGNASLGLTQTSSDNEDTFLMDAFRLEQSVLKCADVNLYFLPSGTTPEAPSQLYNLPELERLIRQAEALFDWVIIDSSPVLALADANLVAPICDATLFVVRSRKTNAALVKEAIQRIGPERICGLLVNRVGGTSSNAYYSYYNQQSSLRLKA